MPSSARFVGLAIIGMSPIWVCPACLLAQAVSSGEAAYRPGDYRPVDIRAPGEARFVRQAVPPVSQEFAPPMPREPMPQGVVPAGFQTPVRSGDRTESQAAETATGGRTLPPRRQGGGLPLTGPNSVRPKGGGGHIGGLPSLVTAGSSLAVVLGLFFVFAWVMRRATPGGLALLSNEVVEVLGRAPLAARQQVHLVRLGNKLLLVSVSQAGVETLSEVTDPEEVDRLAGICRQSHPGSSTEAFRQVFQSFRGDRTDA